MQGRKRRLVVLVMFVLLMMCVIRVSDVVYGASADDITTLGEGKTNNSSFESSTDKQYLYYKIDVPSVGIVKLSFHLEDLKNGWFYIYDSTDYDESFFAKYCTVASDTGIWNGSYEKIMTPGTYYIVYENTGGKYKGWDYYYIGGKVRISYDFTDLNVNSNIDCDNNDSIPSASVWNYSSASTFTGAFPFFKEDYKDFYKITVDEDSDFHFKFVSTKHYYACFYDPDGKELGGFWASHNEALDQYVADKEITLQKGIYYIGISVTSNEGYYSLTLDSIEPETTEQVESSDSSEDTSSSNTVDSTPHYKNEWVDGKWYDSNGVQSYDGTLVWKSNSTGWWVEDTTGWYPRSSWQKIDGVWYYFKASGYMAAGEYFNGYWFNSNGSLNEAYFLSWKSNSKGWWVEDKSGWWPSNSWLKIDGYWYYFDGSGYMVTNKRIDGYWLGADGACR